MQKTTQRWGRSVQTAHRQEVDQCMYPLTCFSALSARLCHSRMELCRLDSLLDIELSNCRTWDDFCTGRTKSQCWYFTGDFCTGKSHSTDVSWVISAQEVTVLISHGWFLHREKSQCWYFMGDICTGRIKSQYSYFMGDFGTRRSHSPHISWVISAQGKVTVLIFHGWFLHKKSQYTYFMGLFCTGKSYSADILCDFCTRSHSTHISWVVSVQGKATVLIFHGWFLHR